jgi:DNA-binding transcriptional LysR family regulator
MLDLELLNTLVCVVDEGSFTRAGERVHRTQSTVSQQIRKLEAAVGRTLLLRDRTGNHVSATEHGELLAQYARRLLALSREAQDALTSDVALEPVRIGVPEDFDARRMSAMLSGFVKMKPCVRLQMISGTSVDLQRNLPQARSRLRCSSANRDVENASRRGPNRLCG